MKDKQYPLISVIVPIYNTQDFLPACIESILMQTHRALQIILVNDGSTDASASICCTYAKKDSRIVVLEQKNSGPSISRNNGLQHASGDYIIFIDSDDFWNSNHFLSNLISIASKHNCDMVMFPFWHCTENGVIIEKQKKVFSPKHSSLPINDSSYAETLCNLVRHGILNVSAWGSLYRADFLKEKNFLFKEGLWSEDIEWCLRVLAAANSLVYTNQNFYVYRNRASSITHSQSSKRCTDLFSIIDSASHSLLTADCEPTISKALLGFLAYEYYVLLGLKNYLHLPDTTINLASIRWVTAYNCDSKATLCKWLCRLIGEKAAGKLLGRIINKKLEVSSHANL